MSLPNILLVLSDDHAAHSISAYGSRVNSTPHIDRLAAEGALMEAACCTNSICTPSRASILTGTYSHVNRACSIYSQFDHRVGTFPEVLHDTGYQTAVHGKWHLGTSEVSLPRGMDDWSIFPDQGAYVDPVMIDPAGEETVPGYATDIVTSRSIEFLDRRDPERPFCLLVHHKAPHRPWIPHPRYEGRYTEGTIPEPETIADDHAGRSTSVRRVAMRLDDLTLTDVKEPVPPELEGEEHRAERSSWKYQRYMRDYLRCVQAVDDSVGELLDHLDEHELAEMVTNVDMAATLLEAAGISPTALPEQQGRSFLPLLRGERVEDWPEAVYYRYWEHDDPEHHAPAHYGVRTRTHTYVHYYNDGLGTPGSSGAVMPEEIELYDNIADRQQLTNIADDPAAAGIREELSALLARLQDELGDAPYEGPGTPRLEWPR